MAAILTTLFRGLATVAIVTLVVAVTWSLYIYREPIATTIEPVTRLFQSAADEPARAAATVAPAPAPEPVAPPAANNTAPPQPAGDTTAN